MPNYFYGGKEILDMQFGRQDSSSPNQVNKVYNSVGDIIWARRATSEMDTVNPFTDRIVSVVSREGDITADGTGVIVINYNYSTWLKPNELVLPNPELWNVIVEEVTPQTPNTVQFQLTITALSVNLGDAFIVGHITQSFDDSEWQELNNNTMANIDITVTQSDAPSISGFTFNGIASSVGTATIAYSPNTYTLTVSGEEGAEYTIAENTDPNNTATIPTGPFTIGASGAESHNVVVLENNDHNNDITFSFTVSNTKTPANILPATPFVVTQAADNRPVVTITTPGAQNLGVPFDLAYTVTGDHGPFSIILASNAGLTENVQTLASIASGVEGTFEVTPTIVNQTWYIQATDQDGDRTVASTLATSTGVTASGNDETILWNVISIPVKWTSSVGGIGAWATDSTNAALSAITYNTGDGEWNATLAFTPSMNESVTTAESFIVPLNYSNGGVTVDDAGSFTITRRARPLVAARLSSHPSNTATIAYNTSSISFTVLHDTLEEYKQTLDNGGTSDVDFLNLTAATAAGTAPTGAQATTSAMTGETTVPAAYARQTVVTYTVDDENMTVADVMDLIQLQTGLI